jgi:glutamine synthetase
MMQREDLVFIGVCDLAGRLRGKAFPQLDLESRLRRGVGYEGANIMMSAFGPIRDDPSGAVGELALIPDRSTRVDVEFTGSAAERFYLADIRTPDDRPWCCCPRNFLRSALAELQQESGLKILAAFEQEFSYAGGDERADTACGHDAYRRQGLFAEVLLSAIRRAGVTPDAFLPQYAARQYQVTVAPTVGLRAADEAVIVREMIRAVAFRFGRRASFAPLPDPGGSGNGTQVHFSLLDEQGHPVMYDSARPFGLSARAGPFIAGILHHLPAITALTAPSVASYFRLRPGRSAPVCASIGEHDQSAALRVCRVFDGAPEAPARQFNVEFRVSDATASPYLTLGAIVHAGIEGVRRNMSLGAGIASSRALPRSLEEALDLLSGDAAMAARVGARFGDAYLRLKRAEIAAVKDDNEQAICARYAAAY